jgi:phage-related holin
LNKEALYMAITDSIRSLQDVWVVKLITSFFLATIYNLHVQLICAFAVLVFLDLGTKWLALSKMHLENSGKEVSIIKEIKNIPAARRAGYIKSTVMKNRFIGKMFIYCLLTFCGGVVDLMLIAQGRPPMAVSLVVGYLSVNELLSIVENLQDAGVEEAKRLKEIIDRKLG